MSRVAPLPRMDVWQKGDKLTADHLNQPIDALRSISHYGASVQPAPPPPFREMFPGSITDKGPNGETYSQVGASNEQYWVKKQFIRGGKPWEQITFGDDDTATKNTDNPNDDGTITVLATNLAEWMDHTHSLPKGMPVMVFAWWDGGLTPNGPADSTAGTNQKHYFMWATQVGPIPVTLAQDGGTAGANTPTPTAASFTYTVTRANGGGDPIGRTVAVWPARQLGHATAATKGLALYIASTLYVVQHDEVIDASACS
jgi:hypothetical protein